MLIPTVSIFVGLGTYSPGVTVEKFGAVALLDDRKAHPTKTFSN